MQLFNAAFLKSDDLMEAAMHFARKGKGDPKWTSYAVDCRTEFAQGDRPVAAANLETAARAAPAAAPAAAGSEEK